MTLRKILALSLISLMIVILSACASSASRTPTPDPAQIYTEVAQTVQAGLTQTAAAMPTATPTITPPPTATATPTPEVTPPALSETATPAASPTRPGANLPDRAEWVSQSPADGTVFLPGQEFTMTWTIRNIGDTTWTTAYQLRFYLANQALRLGASDIKFPKEVKKGETVDLSLNMKAPTTPGDYTSVWVLTNANGQNFYTVFITIKVTGATATYTATSTTAPTATPTVETPTP